jgi:hypothetical protein
VQYYNLRPGNVFLRLFQPIEVSFSFLIGWKLGRRVFASVARRRVLGKTELLSHFHLAANQ